MLGVEPGLYCFAFDPADAERISVDFYIVDEYAKVGGVLTADADSRGNGTHALDGVVGFAGDKGAVGSITVNYRAMGQYCTFTPLADLKIGETATGVSENAPVRANGTFDNSCGGTAGVWILGRGGQNDAYNARGAFTILDAGDYNVQLDLGSTAPPANWVPMDRGNNHVGTR